MGQLVSDVQQVLDYKKNKKQAETQRQKILADMATDEKTKTNLVKKALATQRAKYGASGMSSNTGITEGAVLRRMQSEVAQPYDEKRKSSLEKLRKVGATKPNLLKTLLARFDDLVG